MSLSEYLLIEGAAADRLRDLRRSAARPGLKDERAPAPTLATVLYVASALRARPRGIDHYIDYFGDQALNQR
jgi:hypothetical protein